MVSSYSRALAALAWLSCSSSTLVLPAVTDDALSLLQVQARLRNKHAIDPHAVRFGCSAQTEAANTCKCSIWGDPHVTRTFHSQDNNGDEIDFFQSGVFKAAEAMDGSWVVQIFVCPTDMEHIGGMPEKRNPSMVKGIVLRVGTDIIEVVNANPPGVGGVATLRINGDVVDREDLPLEMPGGLYLADLDLTHLGLSGDGIRGLCIDHAEKKFSLKITQSAGQLEEGLNMLNFVLEADTFTVNKLGGDWSKSEDDGSGGICGYKAPSTYHRMPSRAAESQPLFSPSSMQSMCQGCGSSVANTCQMEEPTLQYLSPQEACAKQNGVTYPEAEDACRPLAKHRTFYADCILDFCVSGGQPEVVSNAVAALAVEEPEPHCAGVRDAGECHLKRFCDESERLDLTKLAFNNLGGLGPDVHRPTELRFENVANGRAISDDYDGSVDLAVTALSSRYRAQELDQNGLAGKLGEVNVARNSSVTLRFSLVQSGTGSPGAPVQVGVLALSVFNLESGSERGGAKSVRVCGADAAVIQTDTELEELENGEDNPLNPREGRCYTFRGTTPGNTRDNPDDPEDLSPLQAARTVAFVFQDASYIDATFSVDGGKGGRNFLFALSPSITCTRYHMLRDRLAGRD